MAKKYLVTLTQERSPGSQFRIFNISFARDLLGLLIYGAFDLRVFNQSGYLVKFVDYFRPKELTCYILFSAFAGLHGVDSRNIDKVLDMSGSYLALKPVIPEKWTEKLAVNSPNLIHFFDLKAGTENIRQIFDYIDSIDTRYQIIFAPADQKENLFTKIKELNTKNSLNETELLSLGLEMIGLRYGKYGVEESFRVITSRFELNQIKSLILNSAEEGKFEVVVK